MISKSCDLRILLFVLDLSTIVETISLFDHNSQIGVECVEISQKYIIVPIS